MLDVIPVEPAANCCPVCGAMVPEHAPQGLCPQCVMRCVLSDADSPPPVEEESTPTTAPDLPAAPSPADLAAHFPELEIIEFLGQGGMGAVYKARQRKLDRLVALKVLPPEWGRDPAFAERFAREARALARLNHPQVVGVHDFGEAGGHYYLIMEFVDGGSLRQLLAAGRVQPWQALPIVAQVCDALQYAHEQGVVHRDIKPENILLDRRGQVKIADFGLAKLMRRSRSEFTLTNSGQVMGTLDYMAPEQRTSPQAVDHRADIYSLGVVFYEMLTGELPLGRFAPPSEKASVDGQLDQVIFRALERDRDRRYQRISAVKADVDSILRGDSRTPAASPRRPVRSFFLSVFSMVAPRSVLERFIADARPAPRRQPPRPASQQPAPSPSRRAGRAKRLLWLIPVAAGALVVLLVGLQGGPSNSLRRTDQDERPQGLLVGDPDELETTLSLFSGQLNKIKQILRGADREYLDMEQRHTSRTVSREPGSQGHLLVTISPFVEEATQLESRVWAKLNSILIYNDQQAKAEQQLPQRGSLFAFGREEVKVEIWREGSWYHWKVTPDAPPPFPPGQAGPSQVVMEEGNGTQLPRRYERFWQGGPP
jgi:serine/threonine protein kinase